MGCGKANALFVTIENGVEATHEKITENWKKMHEEHRNDGQCKIQTITAE